MCPSGSVDLCCRVGLRAMCSSDGFPWGASLRDEALDTSLALRFLKFPDDSWHWNLGFRKMFAIEVGEVSHDWIIGQVCSFHSKEGLRWMDTKRDFKICLGPRQPIPVDLLWREDHLHWCGAPLFRRVHDC